MNVIDYLKYKGIKHAIFVIYRYKVETILEKIVAFFCKNKPLKKIIMIESHNDFDCNGGAFYEYLITHGYNNNYRIVWRLKNRLPRHYKLPSNVDYVYINKPGIKKAYYFANAMYFLSDSGIPEKRRNGQISIYATHGGVTFKNVKGLLVVDESVDYILCASRNYAPIMCNNYSIPYPNKRMVYIGYPSNDYLFVETESEIKKITEHSFDKVILWMPTFRKNIEGRKDTVGEAPYGIPLLDTDNGIRILDLILSRSNCLLIVKYHPMQDLASTVAIENLRSIIFIDANKVKDLKIDIYRLMKDCDALISDYSSSAYSYLLLNRPIAFILSDLKEYKLGFTVDNYEEVLAGHKILTHDDFIKFISDVNTENDIYKEKREKLLKWLYEYQDGKCCERLVEFMKL